MKKRWFENLKEAKEAAKERGERVFKSRKKKKRPFFVGTGTQWLNAE